MVDVIYKGAGRINFMTKGKFQRNVKNGDVITDVPKEMYDKDLKNDPRFEVLKSKSNKNKMQQSMKGSEE